MERTKVPKSVIRASYLEQAKLTQAHAWLALGIEGALSETRLAQVQSTDFEIAISESSTSSYSDLAKDSLAGTLRSAKIGDAWQLNEAGDALTVQATLAPPNRPGFFLESELVFKFAAEPQLLPPISSIVIKVVAEATHCDGDADLIKSRLLSTNHRWHTLVEDPNRSPEPFRELLGERFRMEYGHGSVTSYEEFCAWVRGSASSVNASRHDLESVSWRVVNGNEYEAVFVLDWLGLDKNNKTMAAKTKHTWTFSDDLSEAYPRIQHMDVQFLEPFSIIE